MADCQNYACGSPAVRTIKIPPFTRDLKPMVFGYCGFHADEILGDRLAFPGAEEVEVIIAGDRA